MRPTLRLAAALLAGVAVAAAGQGGAPGGDLAGVLGGDASGFARADRPREFRFPADHAAHPDFRTEWWYFTGNLAGSDGRAFGFQLTFFRFALAAEPPASESTWAGRQVWMAHFALTDVAGGRFHAEERFAREGPGLAGAEAPFAVWLEDWQAAATGTGAFPVRLQAAADGFGIDLELEQGKPIVLQGDAGLSRKSAAPGNASYYYSLTRMPARGVVTVGGERIEVDGRAWLDREWSTSALGPDQVGWDWYALQLDDGRDLMFYRLRLAGGGSDPMSAGVLVAADGSTRALGVDDVVLQPLGTWQAADGGARYPLPMRLGVPSAGLDLELRPRLAGQEWRGRFRYWEGAVEVLREGAAAGHGYIEMTGYAEPGTRPAGEP